MYVCIILLKQKLTSNRYWHNLRKTYGTIIIYINKNDYDLDYNIIMWVIVYFDIALRFKNYTELAICRCKWITRISNEIQTYIIKTWGVVARVSTGCNVGWYQQVSANIFYILYIFMHTKFISTAIFLNSNDHPFIIVNNKRLK